MGHDKCCEENISMVISWGLGTEPLRGKYCDRVGSGG